MKKIILIILTVVLCMSLTAPAFAAGQKGDQMISDMKPENVKASGYNYSKIRISWDAMENVDGYIVYRASSENGTYKKVYTKMRYKKSINSLKIRSIFVKIRHIRGCFV